MLAARGRIEIAEPADVWLEEIEGHPLIEVLPLTSRIAAESIRLGPDFHNDPADQIIVATARIHGLLLMTADERIRKWVLFIIAASRLIRTFVLPTHNRHSAIRLHAVFGKWR